MLNILFNVCSFFALHKDNIIYNLCFTRMYHFFLSVFFAYFNLINDIFLLSRWAEIYWWKGGGKDELVWSILEMDEKMDLVNDN